jgi:small-conductance mechanosensitive channel
MDAPDPAGWIAEALTGPQVVRIAVLAAVYAVTSLLVTWLTVRVGRARGHDGDRIRAMLGAIRVFKTALFLLLALLIIGVEISMIHAYVGSFLTVVGVACFATWSVLSNVTAGVILFWTKDLHAGDRIRIGTGEHAIDGRIVEFRLWTMALRRDDGCMILVPNNRCFQEPVTVLEKTVAGRTTQLIEQAARHD